jgi:peroxiredoxin
LNGPLGEDIEKKGIKIILVDIGESLPEVQSYIKKNNIRFEVLLDEDEKVSEQYNLVGVPTLVFVDKDGLARAVEHSIPDNYEEKFTAKP